jgi:hypothetical protein
MNRPISVPDHDTFSDRETANVRDHLDTLRGPFRITVHVEGLEPTFYMICSGYFRREEVATFDDCIQLTL